MGHGLFVIWSLMGLNLHFPLKYYSLKRPLTSGTDVPVMMEIVGSKCLMKRLSKKGIWKCAFQGFLQFEHTYRSPSRRRQELYQPVAAWPLVFDQHATPNNSKSFQSASLRCSHTDTPSGNTPISFTWFWNWGLFCEIGITDWHVNCRDSS